MNEEKSTEGGIKYCSQYGSPIKKGEEMYMNGKAYCPYCWVYLINNRERPIEKLGK